MSEGKAPVYLNASQPRNNWWQGAPFAPELFGQLFRLRFLIPFVITNAGTVGGFLIWANFHWAIYVAIGTVLTFLVIVLCVTRMVLLNRFRADDALHLVFHTIRDRIYDLKRSHGGDDRLRAMRQFYDDVCEKVAAYFKIHTWNQGVDVCLRVLQETPDWKRQFVTVARSSGLAHGREHSSQPIPIDKGLVKAFTDRDGEGVYRIDDIRAAVQAHIWYSTENDQRYGDVKKLLVCPVNGYDNDSGVKQMFGLLFVTSQDAPVREVYWDALRAIADTLGMVLPEIHSLLSADGKGDPIGPKS